MYGMTGPLMRVNAATQAVFDAWDDRGAGAEDNLVRLTQEGKVNVNATAAYKCTMLHTAAANNWTRWALLLLGRGAKVDARNSIEETPLLVRDLQKKTCCAIVVATHARACVQQTYRN